MTAGVPCCEERGGIFFLIEGMRRAEAWQVPAIAEVPASLVVPELMMDVLCLFSTATATSIDVTGYDSEDVHAEARTAVRPAA